MSYRTVNPATGEMGATFADITDAELDDALGVARACFLDDWRHRPVADRARVVRAAAAGLRAVVCALGELGCAIEQPTTMLAMLAVSAIPELRIGNRGLIDSRDYRLVSPVVS